MGQVTTVQEVIDAAASHLQVKVAETDLGSDDFQVLLNNLNDMLQTWKDSGITKAFEEVESGDDILKVDRSAIMAIKSNLAIMSATFFNRAITPALSKLASESYTRLLASVVHIGHVAYPDTMPLGDGGRCNSDYFTNEDYPPQNLENNF